MYNEAIDKRARLVDGTDNASAHYNGSNDQSLSSTPRSMDSVSLPLGNNTSSVVRIPLQSPIIVTSNSNPLSFMPSPSSLSSSSGPVMMLPRQQPIASQKILRLMPKNQPKAVATHSRHLAQTTGSNSPLAPDNIKVDEASVLSNFGLAALKMGVGRGASGADHTASTSRRRKRAKPEDENAAASKAISPSTTPLLNSSSPSPNKLVKCLNHRLLDKVHRITLRNHIELMKQVVPFCQDPKGIVGPLLNQLDAAGEERNFGEWVPFIGLHRSVTMTPLQTPSSTGSIALDRLNLNSPISFSARSNSKASSSTSLNKLAVIKYTILYLEYQRLVIEQLERKLKIDQSKRVQHLPPQSQVNQFRNMGQQPLIPETAVNFSNYFQSAKPQPIGFGPGVNSLYMLNLQLQPFQNPETKRIFEWLNEQIVSLRQNFESCLNRQQMILAKLKAIGKERSIIKH